MVMKNRKGFTLVELVVTIAIMAVVVGAAAGIGVFASANRKQKTAADAETQEMYRILIGCVLDLAEERVYPAVPGGIPDPGRHEAPNDGWYGDYAKKLVERSCRDHLHDLPVYYCDDSGDPVLAYNPSNPRQGFFAGGNKHPYNVVQVRNRDGKPVLIVSYHNDAHQFDRDGQIGDLKTFHPYETNGGNPIAYVFEIRTGG